jgi:hypothetical protein
MRGRFEMLAGMHSDLTTGRQVIRRSEQNHRRVFVKLQVHFARGLKKRRLPYWRSFATLAGKYDDPSSRIQ